MPLARTAIDLQDCPKILMELLNSASSPTPLTTQPTPAQKTTATTLTAAELLGGLIVANPASTVNYQLPLVSDLETAWVAQKGTLNANDAFRFTINNIATAANIATLTTNTGWTLSGAMTVAGAAAEQFLVVRTSSSAYTIYRS